MPKEPNGTICRPIAGVCDVAETYGLTPLFILFY